MTGATMQRSCRIWKFWSDKIAVDKIDWNRTPVEIYSSFYPVESNGS